MNRRNIAPPAFIVTILFVLMVASHGPVLAAANVSLEPPMGETVYNAPDPLPAGNHGDLIWATEIKTDVANARAWKVLYLSTDVHDTPVAVSGVVVAPKGTGPVGGRPVVSFAHGTTGIARQCAPSLVENPAKDSTFYSFPDSADNIDCGVPALTKMIAAGYVVAATDYQGLGTSGVHQYLVGPTEARNVLDAATAAQQIPQSEGGRRTVVLGWSQGGQASIWASQIADYSAATIELLGAVSLAPVNALEQAKIEDALVKAGKTLPTMTGAETLMSQYAMTKTFPELKLADILTPLGIEYINAAAPNQCNKHLGTSLDYIVGWKGAVSRKDMQDQAAWFKRIEEMALGNMPAKTPISVHQGDDDPIIYPAATDAYVQKACASGTVVSYKRYPKTDHLRVPGVAEADYLPWIADRFEGKRAPSTCK